MDNQRRTGANAEQIRLVFDRIVGPGNVTEIRCLKAQNGRPWGQGRTFAGWFDDPEKAIAELSSITSAKGVYFVPNALDPAILNRCANKLSDSNAATTSDDVISRRRYLLIDCDPIRPDKHISANAHERGAARDLARTVYNWLTSEGWPEPIAADSGNGFHLMYRIDLPTDDSGVVEWCLKELARRFSNDQADVDTSVFNPARIWKLPGTLACKGDNTQDRPHRRAEIIHLPDAIKVVPYDLLLALAVEPPADEPKPMNGRTGHYGKAFDVSGWLTGHGIAVHPVKETNQGRVWILKVCPFNPDHTDNAAFVRQLGTGVVQAGCHHNSCRGHWDWKDLRGKYEPEYAERNTADQAHVEPEETPAGKDIQAMVYRPFPTDTLPEELREFVKHTARAVRVDEAFVGLPALVCCASAIGNARALELGSDWTAPSLLWGAIVGMPGSRKSPALDKCFAPLVEIQRDTEHRITVDDATVEAIAAIMKDHPGGLVSVNDELSTWIASFDRYNTRCDGRWCSLYNAAPLIVDRKGGPEDERHIRIDNACISVAGGIQPGTLREMMTSTYQESGLVSRLLWAFPPRKKRKWYRNEGTRVPSAGYHRVVKSLYWLRHDGPPDDDELEDDGENLKGVLTTERVILTLTDTAADLWERHVETTENELLAIDDELLAGIKSKLEGIAGRFALVLQLADAPEATEVSVEWLQAGINLADWFWYEARRVWSEMRGDARAKYRKLIDYLERKGTVTAREVAQGPRQYRGRGGTEKAELELRALVAAGVARSEMVDTAGRPCELFTLATATEV